jgi:hypothetical protein
VSSYSNLSSVISSVLILSYVLKAFAAFEAMEAEEARGAARERAANEARRIQEEKEVCVCVCVCVNMKRKSKAGRQRGSEVRRA